MQKSHNITLNIKVNYNDLDKVMSKVNTQLGSATTKAAKSFGGETRAAKLTTSAIKQYTASSNNAAASTTIFTNDIVRHIRQMESLVVGVYSVKKAYDATLGVGHEYNKLLENETAGMKVLIVQNLKSVDALGKKISLTKKYAAAEAEAAKAIELTRKINPETPYNLGDTIKTYKALFPQLIKYKASLTDIADITKKMTILGKAMNLDTGQFIKTIDTAFSGHMKPSQMQMALNQIGITNQLVKKWKEHGTLVENVKKRLSEVSAELSGISVSFDTAASNLETQWDTLWGKIQKPIFDNFKKDLIGLSSYIKNNEKAIIDNVHALGSLAHVGVSALGALAIMKLGKNATQMRSFTAATRLARIELIKTGVSTKAVNAEMATLRMRFKLAGITVKAFWRSLMSVGKANAPFLILTGIIEGVSWAIGKSEERLQKFNDALSATNEEIGKMTTSQLNFEELASTRDIEAKQKEIAKLRGESARGGTFLGLSTDADRLVEIAKLIEEKQKEIEKDKARLFLVKQARAAAVKHEDAIRAITNELKKSVKETGRLNTLIALVRTGSVKTKTEISLFKDQLKASGVSASKIKSIMDAIKNATIGTAAKYRDAASGAESTATSSAKAAREIANAKLQAAQLADNLRTAGFAFASALRGLRVAEGSLNPLQAEYDSIKAGTTKSVGNVNVRPSMLNVKSLEAEKVKTAYIKEQTKLIKLYSKAQTEALDREKESMQIQMQRKMIGADTVAQKKLEVSQAKRELEYLKQKAAIDKSHDYSNEIARKNVEILRKQKEEAKAIVAAHKKGAKEAASAYNKAYKDILEDARKTAEEIHGIFKSGLTDIFHGDIFGGLSQMFHQLGDKMMEPAIDRMAADLTAKFSGAFGTDLGAQFGKAIADGVQEGFTPKLAGKLFTNDAVAAGSDFLKKLGRVESGNNYFIKPNRFGYSGRFQFRHETAAPFLKQLGASWSDYMRMPAIQDKVVIMELQRNAEALKRAGIKINEMTLWMSHNQGVGGTKQILSGNVSPTVRRNISTNIGKGMAPTPENYIRYWSKTFSGAGVNLGKSFTKQMGAAGQKLGSVTGSQIGEALGATGGKGNLFAGIGMNLLGAFIGNLPSIIGSLFSTKLTEQQIKAATGAKKFSGTGFEAIYTQFNDAQWKLLDVTQKSYQHLASMDRNFKSVAYALNPSSSGQTSMMAPSGENWVKKESNVLFGLFKSSSELISSGLILGIDSFTKGFKEVATYYTEKVTDSFFFGLITTESINEIKKGVDPKTVKAFNGALKEGYNSIIDAAVSMGFDKSKIEAQLKKAHLTIGKDDKIDLKGLSPEEQSKRIQAAFSEMFSGAVLQVGDLNRITNKYIKAGDNQYETLMKLAIVTEQVSHGLGFLGIKLKDIDKGVMSYAEAWETLNPGDSISTKLAGVVDGVHSIYTATEQYIDIATGAGGGGKGAYEKGAKVVSQGLQAYYNTFLTKSEQLHSLTSDMSNRLKGVDKTMPKFQNAEDAKAWFKDQMENWDHASKKANEEHGKLIAMTGEYAEYVKALEALNKQFGKLNITLGLVGQTVKDFGNMEVMAKGAGGMSQLTSGVDAYFSGFFTKEEQLAARRKSLQEQLAKIGIDMPKQAKMTKEWWKTEVEARKGRAKEYGQVVALTGQYKGLLDLQKQLADQQEQSSKKLLDLYTGQYSPLTMLQKTEFARRTANNTDGGALKALEMAYKSARTQEDYAKEFNRYAADLTRQSKDATLKDVADKIQEQTNTLEEQARDIRDLKEAQQRLVELQQNQGVGT